jgi:general stress protein YciG
MGKDKAAVSLGRKGGKAKVPKGFAKMDPEKLREIGRKTAEKRWGKKDG